MLAAEAFGGYGGIAQSTRDLVCAFSSHDRIASIEVLPRHAVGPIEELPTRVKQREPRSGRLAYSIRALSAAIRNRPHIIYCGHLFMVPLAAALSRVIRAKLIVHVHGIELWSPLSPSCRHGIEQADLVLCVSNDTRRRLLRSTTLSPSSAAVVFNTYAERFTVGDRRAARRAFGLTDETVLLTVSRLDDRQRHKGHDLVIPLIPVLRAKGRDVVYLVAGDGDDRARLEGLARSNAVADHVRFIGRVPDSELPNLYRAADLYVMPSSGEGFGIAFIEAMACGTPAIGLAAGGASDALCHGELGHAVTVQEFPAALQACVDGVKPNGPRLAQAVNKRFGRDAFRLRVDTAMGPLLE